MTRRWYFKNNLSAFTKLVVYEWQWTNPRFHCFFSKHLQCLQFQTSLINQRCQKGFRVAVVCIRVVNGKALSFRGCSSTSRNFWPGQNFGLKFRPGDRNSGLARNFGSQMNSPLIINDTCYIDLFIHLVPWAGLMPWMILGRLTLSQVACPSLPNSPSPQLNTSPEAASASMWPPPPFEADTWTMVNPLMADMREREATSSEFPSPSFPLVPSPQDEMLVPLAWTANVQLTPHSIWWAISKHEAKRPRWKKYFKVVYFSKLIVYNETSQMSDTKYSLHVR